MWKHWNNCRAGQIAIALLLVAQAAAVWTCGIDWPTTLLENAEQNLLRNPEASFDEELEVILRDVELPTFVSQIEIQEDDFEYNPYAEQVAEIDVRQLSDAMGGGSFGGNWRIVDEYSDIRSSLSAYVALAATDEARTASGQVLLEVAFPDTIPKEFSIYLQGAIQYHTGNIAEATRIWESLFELPEAQRLNRSFWAAYMLGRVYSFTTPEKAVPWFQKSRDFCLKGGKDPLGLFLASCALEAPIHYKAGRYYDALNLYALNKSEDFSILFAVRRLVREGTEEDLKRAAEDPLTQRIVTAFLVAYPFQTYSGWEEYQEPQTASLTWLTILANLNSSNMKDLDRLALAAYQRGEYTQATRWLDLCAKDSAVAKWVKAKLLIRKGETGEATKLLEELAAVDRPRSLWKEWTITGSTHRDLVDGELGILALNQGRYTESLRSFLEGDFWLDAAYVAEKVLTTEELKAFVDSHHPQGTQPVSMQLRYLLGRRLFREGRSIDVSHYFPPHLQPEFDKYWDQIRISENLANTEPRRGWALMEAARILRKQGMELVGTEIEPDWSFYGGSYSDVPISFVRVGLDAVEIDYRISERYRSEISPDLLLDEQRQDEIQRVRNQMPNPYRRYHYRFQATALAWKASELMPDDDEQTAHALWEAGRWVGDRDPSFADHLYKDLVCRNPNIPLAQAADRQRWFPRADDEGNPILPEPQPERTETELEEEQPEIIDLTSPVSDLLEP